MLFHKVTHKLKAVKKTLVSCKYDTNVFFYWVDFK